MKKNIGWFLLSLFGIGFWAGVWFLVIPHWMAFVILAMALAFYGLFSLVVYFLFGKD